MKKNYEAYKYCPVCGGEMSRVSEYVLKCSECDYTYYVNPRATGSVIITNPRGEVLLTKRSEEPSRGEWDIPGGFALPDESGEAAARREIYEELGLQLGELFYVGSWPNWYEYGGYLVPTMDNYYTSRMMEQEIKVREEVSECKWFKVGEIPWDELAFNSQVKVLEHFLSEK